mgnify:CR=1 FL=1
MTGLEITQKWKKGILLTNSRSFSATGRQWNEKKLTRIQEGYGHDLNSYLVDLKAAIQYGKLDEASSKIDDILDSNKIYKNEISRTGNLVIDSLINYKFSLAQKEGYRHEVLCVRSGSSAL